MSDQAPPVPHGALAHFAVNADDLGASQRFYERLFGWRFEPWGPPGFFMIAMQQPTLLRASLQQRRDLEAGEKTVGFECTIAVDDVHAAIALAVELGGRVVMAPMVIPSVCELAWIADPAGNVLGVARYVSE